ncbi:hypothetical protein K437DRAFT_30513 [Tilletiaria anomala UBC 951]|uniref:Uncharacterized protein n=1 Tax=Tilletiaria anomala (strain ATCC 24038 / CBS 436.72 / UBC 951) TaxID=1037660 RepID=A0A066VGV7_TILAU|nr:uncharacterized protein K437DRAFT_30513 [Tilletiaria anomala UBC 951]KDN37984.1 hypothetical protein K437DRAFT_30513 [Tilletiaria anomala UBC 951]
MVLKSLTCSAACTGTAQWDAASLFVVTSGSTRPFHGAMQECQASRQPDGNECNAADGEEALRLASRGKTAKDVRFAAPRAAHSLQSALRRRLLRSPEIDHVGWAKDQSELGTCCAEQRWLLGVHGQAGRCGQGAREAADSLEYARTCLCRPGCR